jgi:hypothetical protein
VDASYNRGDQIEDGDGEGIANLSYLVTGAGYGTQELLNLVSRWYPALATGLSRFQPSGSGAQTNTFAECPTLSQGGRISTMENVAAAGSINCLHFKGRLVSHYSILA